MSTIDLNDPGAFAKAFKSPFSENCDSACCANIDFYKFANGKWLQNNPIPEIYPAWGSFLMLRDVNEERCKNILTSEWNTTPHENKMHQLCKRFYDAFMSEDKIEEKGYSPLSPVMSQIDSVSLNGLTELIVDLHSKYGVQVLFSYGDTIDKKNSDQTIAGIYQAGISLPDRDYYFDEDKKEKCELFVGHVKEMLELMDVEGAEEKAKVIFDFEKAMAEKFMTKTELRDPEKTYNIKTISDLTSLCPGIDWPLYLRTIHSVPASGSVEDAVGMINVATVAALSNLGALLTSTPLSTLQTYFKWKVLHSFAPHLSSPFVLSNFNFYSTHLAGTKTLKPRWKRSMSTVESYLGESLGQLYCSKHFSGDSKPMALSIVESVRDALKERLNEVEWMSDKTREAAMEKMKGFRVQIGFPDEWIDYSFWDGKITDDHFTNILTGLSFEHTREIARINKPTDKNRWYMTPQMVNAYYHPSMNLICFPAAILQPPFFDAEADLAVNYGGMGAVVGHEMTHGFDDKGSKYDAKGNMENWWTEEDQKNFEGRVEVMVNQAEKFEVLGQKLKGKLTAGENLADLGGLKLSLRALKKRMGEDNMKSEASKIDGFTPMQRFFLSWATVWRQNITDERAKQLVTIDPHGPNDFRANGPLSNMPEFHEAFDVKPEDPMYKPVEERVDVW
ncbi:hypothetical protein TrST_g11196 [Triparma strigata]|uniref:Uncharacterized protein n=1 Tax=Triparma strigata TaxID=1606541 RepID=A0A9W7ER68_9STRA|nr:hypothetical protein TrST_g11196 [Triparma strigata]